MRSLKVGIAGLALAVGVALAPVTASAVASFESKVGANIGIGFTLSGAGALVPGLITGGTGFVDMVFTNNGVTTNTQQMPSSSSIAVSNVLPAAVASIDISTNKAPRGIGGFMVDYVGLASDGGFIGSEASASMALTVRNTGSTEMAVDFVVFPNLSASASAGVGETANVQSGLRVQDATGAFLNSQTRFVAIDATGFFATNNGPNTFRITAAGGQSVTYTLLYQTFGFAESIAPEVIPVPAALPLLASAVFGVGLLARRRRKAA